MFFKDLYFFLKNLTYLTKSRIPHKKLIALGYIRISLKGAFFRLFHIKSKREKFFGFTIEAFDYRTIHFLYGEIFLRGEYFFTSHNVSPIILDCGANIGMATLFFKWLYPQSKVYAFEPDPQTYALLERNVAMNNLQDVYLNNCAITDKEGVIDFFSSDENPGSLLMSVNASRMKGRSISVRTISLNTFVKEQKLEQVDFAKIDIEGSENELVQDMSTNKSLNLIHAFAIEYHHNIHGEPSKLGLFLGLLEQAGFTYQIDAHMTPLSAEGKFQDIIIRGYSGK